MPALRGDTVWVLGLLLSLIQEYAAAQPLAVAQSRLARVKADLPNVKLAWMGGLEKGQGHYYRIQGSTFLIDYDNTQNHASHIHCVWQEFKGNWGKDLLAEHYRTAPHHAEAWAGRIESRFGSVFRRMRKGRGARPR